TQRRALMLPLSRRLAAEALGTAFLLAIVVGSGIMGEQLAAGNAGLALLANSLATGAGLYVLITLLGPLSGAHFNPAVSLVMSVRGDLPRHELLPYVLAQITGAVLGVLVAHAMFDLPLWQLSAKVRSGGGQAFSEFIASFGLVCVILLALSHAARQIPALVAAYITAAYWFTASTSFANPAVTLARSLSATFAGIRMADAPLFIVMQCSGALLAVLLLRWLLGPAPSFLRESP
ncbi:MAG: MIP/aquaporin family protein, partial [Pedobacter sp.]|nr:MIP/aquaporin family protein [Pedobacter sp.]